LMSKRKLKYGAVVAVAKPHAITDAEITRAMAGFEAGGDAGAVELCERALAGNGEARAKAADLIAYSAGNMRKEAETER
jgi:hypothetical protein